MGSVKAKNALVGVSGRLAQWSSGLAFQTSQEGEVLESYITKSRDKGAALRFMKKALKRHGSPEAITTGGLRSYKTAMNELGNASKCTKAACRHTTTSGLRLRRAGTNL